MLISSVVLINDNACVHIPAHIRVLQEQCNLELLDHQPTVSPDINPSEYNLFTYLKNWL
jgi:hypothetical protein